MATRGQTNLYVKNFGQDIDESKLCQLFSVYGTITSCKIATDENGQSKGFGYVNFERPDMATNVSDEDYFLLMLLLRLFCLGKRETQWLSFRGWEKSVCWTFSKEI